MKRVTLFSLMALILAACSQEENPGTVGGQQELQLTSRLAATRGDVQSEQIVENETVWAWVSHTGDNNPDAALYKAVQLTAQSEGALKASGKMLFPEENTGVDVCAVHGTFAGPSFEAGITPLPASIGFQVAADQSQGGDAYVQSDLLYALAKGQKATELVTVIPLEFYHMLSKVELKIVKSSSVGYDVSKVTLDGVAIDGTFTPDADADLTLQPERAAMIQAGVTAGAMQFGTAADSEESNDAILVPQDISGKTITFTLSDGSTLTHTFADGTALESGKRHIFTFTLKDRRFTMESSI